MKTDQERIDALAEKIRNFNILVSGGGEISGGFGELPPRGQGDITLDHIEKAFSEFRLQGNNGIQAAGSLQHGYILSMVPGGGAIGFPQSPTPISIPISTPCNSVSLKCDRIESSAAKCGYRPLGPFDDICYALLDCSTTLQNPVDCGSRWFSAPNYCCPGGTDLAFGRCGMPGGQDYCLEHPECYGGDGCSGPCCCSPCADEVNCDGCTGCDDCLSGHITFAVEDENTIDICGLAYSSLPPYPGTFTGDCASYFDDSNGGCAIGRFRYKFTIPDAASSACSISYYVSTYDHLHNLTNCEIRTTEIAAGNTESETIEQLEPSANGFITVSYPIIGCCCFEGFVYTDTPKNICDEVGGMYFGDCCPDCESDPQCLFGDPC